MSRHAGAAAEYLGVDLARTKGGKIDWETMKRRGPVSGEAAQAFKEMDYAAMAKEAAYRGGGGVLGRADAWLGERALRARIAAQTGGAEGAPGMMGKGLVGLQEMGGGSVMGGAAEGGMGAIAALAGPLAVVAAIKTAVEGFIDTAAKTNQAIEKGMGGALFTPGMTGGQALKTVRDNLTANIFNAYGQNLERNLAIAQAMQEQGLDITEVARDTIRGRTLAGGGAPDTGAGFLGGGFGEFQRNAMVAGRALGLTDVQTVTRMTKMLHEMRQTFESTHDFLEQVNTSARAAGISTTKYLSIIDELTAQFDKLNKSFNETVNLVNALGASGTVTAENLADMANALTGAGEQKTVTQSAAGFVFMSQEMKDHLKEVQQDIIDDAQSRLQDAIKGTKLDVTGIDLRTPAGLLALQSRIAQMPNSLQKQQIQSASDAARYALNQMNAVILPGITGGGRGAVQAAYGMETYGKGIAVQAALQQSLLSEGLKAAGQSMDFVLAHPDKIGEIAAAAAPTLGVKAPDFNRALEALVSVGAGGTQYLKGMEPGRQRDRELKRFWDFGKRAKIFTGEWGTPQAMDTLTKALDDSKISTVLDREFTKELARDPGLVLNALTEKQRKADEAAQDQQVKDIAIQTRTTADIYANAFEKFFTLLYDAVFNIYKLLQKLPGLGGGPPVAAGTQATIEDYRRRGMIDVAAKELRDRSAGGDEAAQHALARMDAYTLKKEHTEEEALEYQRNIEAYSAAAAAATVSSKMTPEDWATLKQEPSISDQALQDAAIRSVSANYGGGTFAKDKFWLGKNLDDIQRAALNEQLAQAGMGTVQDITDSAGTHQYINITMTSTQIEAFMNRFGADNLINKSNELAAGASSYPTTISSANIHAPSVVVPSGVPSPASARLGRK
jgi:hypothetical protein